MYFFNPKLITVDFGRAGIKTIGNVFPNTRIYPCYFHLVRKMVLHIKNLNSNNNIMKCNAKNLIFNMKLLLFIDNETIDNFFGLIKEKYYNTNKKFFDYFQKYYMNDKFI